MNSRYSITLNGVNTWVDWGLIPSSRPIFSPPSLKSKYIDLPGEDGQIDITDIHGSVEFSNRTGSFSFIVSDKSPTWNSLYNQIETHLHGKIIRAVVSDDPDWFYEGRFSISEAQSSASFGTIVIDYNCLSSRRENLHQTEDWLWDPFDFETGVVADHFNLEVIGSRDVVISGYPSNTPFIFTASKPMVILYNGVEYPIPAGTSSIPQISKINPPVSLRIYGQGRITIDYRGRSM